MNEVAWWDRFGHLNDRIWAYDRYINSVIRQEYLDDLRGYLFKPGGRLLDYGCGTGWVSLPIAQGGMWVDGIDSSEEQIKLARSLAEEQGVENVRYLVAERLPRVPGPAYDAILLHAVIHHIPIPERKDFLKQVSEHLAAGGKLYIYEPLSATPEPPMTARGADLLMGGVFRLLRAFVTLGRLYLPDIRQALAEGWTMRSPDEQPETLAGYLDLLPEELETTRVNPWHIWSVSYANLCMMVIPAWRKRLERLLPVFYALDRRYRRQSWYPYLRCWPLIAIVARKNG